jgi:hypothetical protein
MNDEIPNMTESLRLLIVAVEEMIRHARFGAVKEYGMPCNMTEAERAVLHVAKATVVGWAIATEQTDHPLYQFEISRLVF